MSFPVIFTMYTDFPVVFLLESAVWKSERHTREKGKIHLNRRHPAFGVGPSQNFIYRIRLPVVIRKHQHFPTILHSQRSPEFSIIRK